MRGQTVLRLWFVLLKMLFSSRTGLGYHHVRWAGEVLGASAREEFYKTPLTLHGHPHVDSEVERLVSRVFGARKREHFYGR